MPEMQSAALHLSAPLQNTPSSQSESDRQHEEAQKTLVNTSRRMGFQGLFF
jgi:hypothetical protein